jgi:AcrR family transcriptional regulator
VAAELGVATMSLYRHVADKDHLLLEMMDASFAGLDFPAVPPASWRERIELAARMLWDVFRRHPWLAPALSVTRPQMVRSAIPFTEWVLTALDGHGLDLQTMFTANVTLFNYIRGTAVNVESENEAEAVSGLDSEERIAAQESALQELVSGGRFPLFERVATTGYDFDLDALFEFGLQRLLDGIATFIDAPRPSP